MMQAGEVEQVAEALEWTERFADAAGLSQEHREAIERLRETLQRMEG
jgi:hypothetical protein